jgi:DNA-binding NarL/FixJ family response regulator
VSIAPRSPAGGNGRLAVALDIDDAELRSRVLQTLNESRERLVLAARADSADVLVADHLLRSDRPPAELPVILVGERSMIDEGLRQGYCGGVLHAFSSEKLRVAVEAAALGLVCTDARAEPMPAFDDDTDSEPGLPALTVREAEVLALLITGASNKEIARRLDFSVHTAKFHVASIVSKLGATGRTEAVARALRSARAMI